VGIEGLVEIPSTCSAKAPNGRKALDPLPLMLTLSLAVGTKGNPGSRKLDFVRLPGNLFQEVKAEVSRSPGRRPQARKCLERCVVARRFARDEAWSDPGNPRERGLPGGRCV